MQALSLWCSGLHLQLLAKYRRNTKGSMIISTTAARTKIAKPLRAFHIAKLQGSGA